MTEPYEVPGRRASDALTRRFGRRAVLLWALGAPWALIGYGFVAIPAERFSRPGPGGALEFLDSGWLGWVWIVGGLTAVLCGVARGWTHRDDWGFISLSVPPFLWSAAYAWSWGANVVTSGESGRASSWIACVVFAAILFLTLFLARWPDPDEPHHPEETR